MRLLGIDFETTGLDVQKVRITEIGCVLWDSMTHRPLVMSGGFVYDPSMEELFTPETVAMMDRVSGITPDLLREFGKPMAKWIEELNGFIGAHKVDYFVAHNGNQYDKPLLAAEIKRHGANAPFLMDTKWLDTKTDIPWPTPPDSNKLKHLALDAGFINPFAHRAITDVMTMMMVLSKQDIDAVVAHSKKPSIVIRAVVPHPKQDKGVGKDKAKAAGFRWQEVDYKVYDLCWVKKIKEDQLEAERAKLPDYQVVIIDKGTPIS